MKTLYDIMREKYGKKPKPILFITEMVRATFNDWKTQTRKVIKGYGNSWHIDRLLGEWSLSREPYFDEEGMLIWWLQTAVDDDTKFRIKPPYMPDDILYVRETWCTHEDLADVFETSLAPGYYYRANEVNKEWANDREVVKWSPSIHMPKKAARIFLGVKSIRVEKLQEITSIGAGAEGVNEIIINANHPLRDKVYEKYGRVLGNGKDSCAGNIAAFATLWDEIYESKGYSWENNPWVWRIEFERIDNGSIL